MKILQLLLFGVVYVLLVAVMGTAFVYAGWNYGVVQAFPSSTHVITFINAWWISVFITTFGGMFFKSEKKDSA